MLNQKMIEALEARGFKRWTKGDMDRLYINPETVGFEFKYNSRGKLYKAVCGEDSYSEREAFMIKNSKTYIDIATGKITYDNKAMFEAARALRDAVAAEIEQAEAAEATETLA